MIITWLPLPDFRQSLEILHPMDLNFQRYNILEIIETLHQVEESNVPPPYHIEDLDLDSPPVKMWRGYELQLCEYGLQTCEHMSVSNDDIVFRALIKHMTWAEGESADFGKPDWFGDVDFHISHQAALVRFRPTYYKEKFFAVDTNMPVVWPVSRYAKEA